MINDRRPEHKADTHCSCVGGYPAGIAGLQLFQNISTDKIYTSCLMLACMMKPQERIRVKFNAWHIIYKHICSKRFIFKIMEYIVDHPVRG